MPPPPPPPHARTGNNPKLAISGDFRASTALRMARKKALAGKRFSGGTEGKLPETRKRSKMEGLSGYRSGLGIPLYLTDTWQFGKGRVAGSYTCSRKPSLSFTQTYSELHEPCSRASVLFRFWLLVRILLRSWYQELPPTSQYASWPF